MNELNPVLTYIIARPCMWFSVGERVAYEKMSEYFTPKAIRSLIADGYLKIVPM